MAKVTKPKTGIIAVIITVIVIALGIGGYFIFTKNQNANQTTTVKNTNVSKNQNVNNANISNLNTVTNQGEKTNLISHWKFDENSGTTTIDSVNNYSGTIMGNASWVTGISGSALDFDGMNDYIELPQEIISETKNLIQGTIAFWFKYDSTLSRQPVMPIFHLGTNSVDEDDNMFIIEIGHGGTESNNQFLDSSNKKLYVTWIKNNQEPVLCFDSNVNIEENIWHHFALVVGPDGNTGYFNGVEMINRDYNFGSSGDKMLFNEIPIKDIFTLGFGKTHHQISPDFSFFKGSIDDLRIYNRPLSEPEIKELL